MKFNQWFKQQKQIALLPAEAILHSFTDNPAVELDIRQNILLNIQQSKQVQLLTASNQKQLKHLLSISKIQASKPILDSKNLSKSQQVFYTSSSPNLVEQKRVLPQLLRDSFQQQIGPSTRSQIQIPFLKNSVFKPVFQNPKFQAPVFAQPQQQIHFVKNDNNDYFIQQLQSEKQKLKIENQQLNQIIQAKQAQKLSLISSNDNFRRQHQIQYQKLKRNYMNVLRELDSKKQQFQQLIRNITHKNQQLTFYLSKIRIQFNQKTQQCESYKHKLTKIDINTRRLTSQCHEKLKIQQEKLLAGQEEKKKLLLELQQKQKLKRQVQNFNVKLNQVRKNQRQLATFEINKLYSKNQTQFSQLLKNKDQKWSQQRKMMVERLNTQEHNIKQLQHQLHQLKKSLRQKQQFIKLNQMQKQKIFFQKEQLSKYLNQKQQTIITKEMQVNKLKSQNNTLLMNLEHKNKAIFDLNNLVQSQHINYLKEMKQKDELKILILKESNAKQQIQQNRHKLQLKLNQSIHQSQCYKKQINSLHQRLFNVVMENQQEKSKFIAKNQQLQNIINEYVLKIQNNIEQLGKKQSLILQYTQKLKEKQMNQQIVALNQQNTLLKQQLRNSQEIQITLKGKIQLQERQKQQKDQSVQNKQKRCNELQKYQQIIRMQKQRQRDKLQFKNVATNMQNKYANEKKQYERNIAQLLNKNKDLQNNIKELNGKIIQAVSKEQQNYNQLRTIVEERDKYLKLIQEMKQKYQILQQKLEKVNVELNNQRNMHESKKTQEMVLISKQAIQISQLNDKFDKLLSQKQINIKSQAQQTQKLESLLAQEKQIQLKTVAELRQNYDFLIKQQNKKYQILQQQYGKVSADCNNLKYLHEYEKEKISEQLSQLLKSQHSIQISQLNDKVDQLLYQKQRNIQSLAKQRQKFLSLIAQEKQMYQRRMAQEKEKYLQLIQQQKKKHQNQFGIVNSDYKQTLQQLQNDQDNKTSTQFSNQQKIAQNQLIIPFQKPIQTQNSRQLSNYYKKLYQQQLVKVNHQKQQKYLLQHRLKQRSKQIKILFQRNIDIQHLLDTQHQQLRTNELKQQKYQFQVHQLKLQIQQLNKKICLSPDELILQLTNQNTRIKSQLTLLKQGVISQPYQTYKQQLADIQLNVSQNIIQRVEEEEQDQHSSTFGFSRQLVLGKASQKSDSRSACHSSNLQHSEFKREPSSTLKQIPKPEEERITAKMVDFDASSVASESIPESVGSKRRKPKFGVGKYKKSATGKFDKVSHQ